MLHQGILGYVIEEDGQLACLDCSIEFLIEHQYIATEEMGEVGGLVDRVKVRGWTSPTVRETLWLPEMEA